MWNESLAPSGESAWNQVIVLSELHLKRILEDYLDYYHLTMRGRICR